jgi:hypothetical protein
MWLAISLYTPLDENLGWVYLAFWAVGCLLIFSSAGRSKYYIDLVKSALAIVGPVPVLIAAFMILNGALDHYPQVQAVTHVVRTYERHHRDSGFFVVVTPSWREGRNQEDFKVVGDFNGHLQTGDLIRVEVHRGAFWLPWGPAVTDRMRCPSGVYGPSLC